MVIEPAIPALKQRLRESARRRRDAYLAAHGRAAAAAIAAHGIAFLAPPPGCVVAAFASMPDELDTAPLLARLRADGYPLALPVMRGKSQPLLFRAWAPGDAMGRGQWGIAEPLPEQPVREPDILLIPLLAFDAAGWRLGYGGGYYDRTLRALRRAKPIVAVGLACDAQAVDAVPHQGYDERLDWVLTPSGPRQFAG